jgi:hypothetical protein
MSKPYGASGVMVLAAVCGIVTAALVYQYTRPSVADHVVTTVTENTMQDNKSSPTTNATKTPDIDAFRRRMIASGLSSEQSAIAAGYLAEYAMQAYRQGYTHGFNDGFNDPARKR